MAYFLPFSGLFSALSLKNLMKRMLNRTPMNVSRVVERDTKTVKESFEG